MKLGIIIYSDHAETVWNACRLANFSLNKGNHVKVFLMAKGVEAESLTTKDFNIKDLLEKFLKNNGLIYACGTCLKIRSQESTELCPLSTMADLYDIINESDKVVSF
jgi:uncharacterized protein involved in oxidation of intracellular sulfur